MPDFLKEVYLAFFRSLASWSEHGPGTEFLSRKNGGRWHDLLNETCREVYNKVYAFSKDPDLARKEVNVKKVVNKFRGNVGEIMAEAIFLKFPSNFNIAFGSYVPVDPSQEEFVDAEALDAGDSLPVGIQVKNYSLNEENHFVPVKRETFDKAQAMTTRWLQDKKRIPEDRIVEFLKKPRQIIFSFTNVDKDDFKLLEDTKCSVVFKGPRDIADLRLETKPFVFKEIVDEISHL